MGRMKPLYDGIKLNCTIVSDTHIDERHPMPWLPKFNLRKALKDSKKSSAPVDAFLTVGDTTSRGSDNNWKMTAECFKRVPNAAKNVILTIGNHDCWNDDGFDIAMKNYLENFEAICGKKLISLIIHMLSTDIILFFSAMTAIRAVKPQSVRNS